MNTNNCVILNFEITVICTIVSCSFVAIFCFVVRKKCNYLWLLIYGSLSLTTFLIYRNVYKEKNKMGSHFVFAYFVFGCVFLFDVISSIYYVVITIQTKNLFLLLIIGSNIYQGIVSALSVIVLKEVACFYVSVIDESYTVLSLIRTSFMTEKTHRIYKLTTFLIISIALFIQYWITIYSKCSKPSSTFSLFAGLLFLLVLVLYLPLYGYQVRNQWIRRIIAIGTPLILTGCGLVSNTFMYCYTCPNNKPLSVYLKVESVFVTVWGVLKLLVALYTKTEYFLYSKEFNDAYIDTENHINMVMSAENVLEKAENTCI